MMSMDRVDTEEFAKTMRGLADRYGERISDGERRFVTSATGAGEWVEALEQLAAGFVHAGVTITKAEREELAGLFRTAGADLKVLDEVPVNG